MSAIKLLQRCDLGKYSDHSVRDSSRVKQLRSLSSKTLNCTVAKLCASTNY
ncbi:MULTISPECIES: hypothetical protein [Fischerella]|uniref:hypothetical protein n=1 Tax=Fischerella TaxID=1190 RepID=UPI000317A048|nr:MULTISPECIES: hypothetical protein [Fischerella]